MFKEYVIAYTGPKYQAFEEAVRERWEGPAKGAHCKVHDTHFDVDGTEVNDYYDSGACLKCCEEFGIQVWEI